MPVPYTPPKYIDPGAAFSNAFAPHLLNAIGYGTQALELGLNNREERQIEELLKQARGSLDIPRDLRLGENKPAMLPEPMGTRRDEQPQQQSGQSFGSLQDMYQSKDFGKIAPGGRWYDNPKVEAFRKDQENEESLRKRQLALGGLSKIRDEDSALRRMEEEKKAMEALTPKQMEGLPEYARGPSSIFAGDSGEIYDTKDLQATPPKNERIGDLAIQYPEQIEEYLNALNTLSGMERREQLAGGTGRNATATRLDLGKNNPEFVAMVRDRISTLFGTEHDDYARDLYVFAGSDPYEALRNLERMKRPAESRDLTLQRTMPEEEQMSYTKANATVRGKESAEQSILSNTTIPGLKPIQGVRQTEDSVKAVKAFKPSLEAIRKAVADVLSEYEKNGWQPIGEQSAAYESKARLAQLLAKETALFNLGVLNGPDKDILEEVIENPGSFKSGVKMARYGKEHVGVRLNNVVDLIDYKMNTFYETHGFEKDTVSGPQAGDVDNVGKGKSLREKYGY